MTSQPQFNLEPVLAVRRIFKERIARRHAVYQTLLNDCLTLSDYSRRALREKRSLTDEEITRAQFRDAPGELAALIFAAELARHFTLFDIAGFYLDLATFRPRLAVTRIGSLWRPVRDERRLIFAVEVLPGARSDRTFLLTSRGQAFGSTALVRQERLPALHVRSPRREAVAAYA